jgi:hypothetical protein
MSSNEFANLSEFMEPLLIRNVGELEIPNLVRILLSEMEIHSFVLYL